ncbi:hypothetical protein AJ80_09524 [Polytolypa hystricis UAMH7299]|uniref:Uncharacterized protein n=1 Tax=Polytolypa hystricis (strain UAMH7299) TaxID=1447883 RepID=A0A2B7WGN4_POLH7|nr:hypothetical protein AJ80_09524 [Polytolypa hystricis UAMH7299]
MTPQPLRISERNESADQCPNFDFKDLDEPKSDFQLYDKPDRDYLVWSQKNKLIDLCKYHTWGFRVGVNESELKPKLMLKILKIISYNQTQELRPTYEDWFDCSSDAGPHLLWPRYRAIQISNNTPEPEGPMTSMPHTLGLSAPRSDFRHPRRTAGLVKTLSTSNDIIEFLERALIKFAYRSLERHPLAFPTGGHNPALCASTPNHFQTSILLSDSRKSFSNLTISDQIPNFNKDPSGYPYALRGSGPIGENDSSMVDCVIVAGKFLEAGSTFLDRGDDPNWSAYLTKVEHAYLEALSIDWAVLAKPWKISCRDLFWNILVQEFRTNRHTEPSSHHSTPATISVGEAWKTCTKSFGQFQFWFSQTTFPCNCQPSDISETKSGTASCVIPEFEMSDVRGIRMEILLARYFRFKNTFRCHLCGSGRGIEVQRIFKELPLRLVVQLQNGMLPSLHTSNRISFRYSNKQKLEQTATYRWLGGIYCISSSGQTPRFRVFWGDYERGEENREIRMYDGMQCDGAIIGNITVPSSFEDKVPTEWWKDNDAPLLFYERVINPDPTSLGRAKKFFGEIVPTTGPLRDILDDHSRWNSTLMQAEEPPLQPRYILNQLQPGEEDQARQSTTPLAVPSPHQQRLHAEKTRRAQQLNKFSPATADIGNTTIVPQNPRQMPLSQVIQKRWLPPNSLEQTPPQEKVKLATTSAMAPSNTLQQTMISRSYYNTNTREPHNAVWRSNTPVPPQNSGVHTSMQTIQQHLVHDSRRIAQNEPGQLLTAPQQPVQPAMQQRVILQPVPFHPEHSAGAAFDNCFTSMDLATPKSLMVQSQGSVGQRQHAGAINPSNYARPHPHTIPNGAPPSTQPQRENSPVVPMPSVISDSLVYEAEQVPYEISNVLLPHNQGIPFHSGNFGLSDPVRWNEEFSKLSNDQPSAINGAMNEASQDTQEPRAFQQSIGEAPFIEQPAMQAIQSITPIMVQNQALDQLASSAQSAGQSSFAAEFSGLHPFNMPNEQSFHEFEEHYGVMRSEQSTPPTHELKRKHDVTDTAGEEPESQSGSKRARFS